jgi:hypothetical protein
MANAAQKLLKRVYPPRNMLFYLQREVLKPASRQRISRIIAGFKPSAIPQATAELEKVHTLDTDGFVMLPPLLNASQIAEVFSYIEDKKCYDRWRPQSGEFPIADAPVDCHTAPYRDKVVIECPHLIEAANHPMVLDIVSKLLGCKPTISSLSLWWSLSGHNEPEEAENFHRDVDEWHFIKLFVYLTDVTGQSGPHVFVKGSHREPKLLPIRRYTDPEVEAAFGRDRIIHFTGSAGTNFLENTFGFHKGQLPQSGARLVFQSQYSLLPIALYKYSPISIVPGRGQSMDPYINRLYIRNERNKK